MAQSQMAQSQMAQSQMALSQMALSQMASQRQMVLVRRLDAQATLPVIFRMKLGPLLSLLSLTTTSAGLSLAELRQGVI